MLIHITQYTLRVNYKKQVIINKSSLGVLLALIKINKYFKYVVCVTEYLHYDGAGKL